MRSRLLSSDWPWAALGAVAIALCVCFPVLGSPGSAALGHPLVDTYNHVWGYWQVGSALSRFESPLHTMLLRWPEGGSLWFIDMMGAVLTLPMQWVFGPVVAYNMALVGNLALAGFGAWLLGRHVTGSAVAAVVTGVSYELMPHLLGQIHDGISETIAAGWLPLALLAALRFHARPDRRTGLVAGLAFSVCALANWYYGLFAALAILPLLSTPRLWRHLVWPVGAVVAVLGPPLALFRQTLNAADALVLRDPDFVGRTLVGHNMIDLLSFFIPGDHHSPNLLARFDEEMIVVVYLGWVLLGLAAWGLRRDPRARPWAAGALLSFVLALGAYLYVDGAYVSLPGKTWVPLPYLVLFENLPLFSPISHAFRFVVPLGLFLGVSAAFGLCSLPRPATAVACLLVAVESLALSPARFPLPISPTTAPEAVRRLPGEGAVIDLPVGIQVLARSRYNLYQVDHGRPIPYGLNDPTPPGLAENLLTREILYLERTSIDSIPTVLPAMDLALARANLVDDGFSAIVVHLDLYPEQMRPRVLEFLAIAVGPGERVGDVVVFAL